MSSKTDSIFANHTFRSHFVAIKDKSKLLASKRIEGFKTMVDTANRDKCALFAITGDLFDNTYGISKEEIKLF